MTQQDQLKSILSKLYTLHEGCELEFKESSTQLPKSFWETYSSFANTAGGFIILGISEKPKLKIIGVNAPEKIISDICNNANNPNKVNINLIENKNICTYDIDGKTIISIYIPELSSARKPLYLQNNPKYSYIRKNEGDYIATQDDLRRFIRNSHDNLDGELLENYLFEDLNLNSILAFKNIIHLRNPSKNYLGMDNLEFLLEMGVFQIDRNDHRKPKLTIAGLLFLGKLSAIYQKFPSFHLEYINRRGLLNNERWKDRVCTGDLNYMDLNIFEFFHIVWEKLKATIEDPFELDENRTRKSSAELSTTLREALANMLIHADYLDEGYDLTVTVDNYFYTFSNPGSMRVSKTQFFTGGKSIPRNNTLITFFRRMGISDRAGTGGKAIFNFAKINKYEIPELTTTMEQTTLKIWVATPIVTHPELDESTKIIFDYIHKNKSANISQILKETNLTKYQSHKAIKELLNMNLIDSIGKGRATKYILIPSIIEKIDAFDTLRSLFIK